MGLNDDNDVHGETQPAMRHRQRLSDYFWRLLGVLCLLAIGLVIAIGVLNTRDEDDIETRLVEPAADAEQIQRGAYLARAGNCQSWG